MTIYVSGDSNSVKRNGWVKILSDHPETPCEVQNISIGGAPSHMSLLRAIQGIEFKKNDVFIWAYGINDMLYITKAGYSVDELVWVLKKIIQICQEAGVVFAPLVFQPRRHSQIRRKTEYRTQLHALFDKCDVPYFDLDEAYLQKHSKQATVPLDFYVDYLHYANEEVVTDLIVNGALGLIRLAKIPNIDTGDLSSVRILNSFPDAEKGVLKNSAVGEVLTWNPKRDGLEVKLTGTGRVVGLFVATTRRGGVWDITFGGHTYSVSVAFADQDFNRTMLKFISLAAVTGRPFDFADGDTISLHWTSSPKNVLADHWFLKELEHENIEGKESALVSVLLELPSGYTGDNFAVHAKGKWRIGDKVLAWLKSIKP